MANENGKEIIRFGNWVVTDECIYFAGEKAYEYYIDKERLWEERDGAWSWLLHLTEKVWIDELDLHQLNTALFFAQDYFKAEKPSNKEHISTWKTLEEQQQLFKMSRR